MGVILGGGRVDNLLGTSVDDGLSLLLGEEDSGGFADVVGSEGTPANLLGVTATRGLDLLSVEDEEVAVNVDGSLGNSVDGVVLVLVGHVVGGGRSGVDCLKRAGVVLHDDTGDKTSDTSESIHSHSGGHRQGGSVGGSLQGGAGESRGGEGIGRAGGEKGDSSSELHGWLLSVC